MISSFVISFPFMTISETTTYEAVSCWALSLKENIINNTKDALDALQILGYNKKEIEKVLEKMNIDEMSTEDIIKNALKLL